MIPDTCKKRKCYDMNAIEAIVKEMKAILHANKYRFLLLINIYFSTGHCQKIHGNQPRLHKYAAVKTCSKLRSI